MTEKLSFIFGEESFLVDEHVQGIRTALKEASTEFLAPDCNWVDVMQMVNSVSLFEPSKCIVWKDPWFLFSAITAKDITACEAMITELMNSDHTMVIYAAKKVDQRKKGAGFLKKKAKVVHYEAFKDWEQDKMLEWLRHRVNRLNCSIDDQALYALVDLGGKNLRHLAGEVEKLRVYLGAETHISLDAVLAISSGVNTGIYNFNEAMKVGNFKTIMTELNQLLDHGEDPIKLLGLFTSNIRFYYQLLSLSKTASFQEIGKVLGKNPYFVKRLIPSIQRHYTLNQCEEAFHSLAKTDVAIKSGKCAPRLAIEMVVLGVYS